MYSQRASTCRVPPVACQKNVQGLPPYSRWSNTRQAITSPRHQQSLSRELHENSLSPVPWKTEVLTLTEEGFINLMPLPQRAAREGREPAQGKEDVALSACTGPSRSPIPEQANQRHGRRDDGCSPRGHPRSYTSGDMRKLREILRLHLEMGLTGRAIARSCGLLVPDGVFVPGEGGVRFDALPPPTQGEVEQLLRVVRHRVLRLLEKRGALPAQGPQDALQAYQAHSLQQRLRWTEVEWGAQGALPRCSPRGPRDDLALHPHPAPARRERGQGSILTSHRSLHP